MKTIAEPRSEMDSLGVRLPRLEEVERQQQLEEHRQSDDHHLHHHHQLHQQQRQQHLLHTASVAVTGPPSTTVFLAERPPSVEPAPRRGGHVVTIRINPDQIVSDGDRNNKDDEDRPRQSSKVNIGQIDTIGKFIVNICESATTTPIEKITPGGSIKINVNQTNGERMVQQHKSSPDMASPYFFCMSSGQCSPSDTLDSGTCSDLDGTPPPLPKKKSSKASNNAGATAAAAAKRVSVTLIKAEAADSEDNESNISCDSLNSSDLGSSSASLHDDFRSAPMPPKMPALKASNGGGGGFLPQGLLKDIRDRSAKLNAVEVVESEKPPTIVGAQAKTTSWLEVDKKSSGGVEEKLTSFKLVAQANNNPSINGQSNINTINKPVIVDVTPIKHPSPSPPVIVNESTYEERRLSQERQTKQEKLATSNTYLYDTDRFYTFHLRENVFDEVSDSDRGGKRKSVVSINNNGNEMDENGDPFDEDQYFAGFKDYKNDDAPSTIRSSKGTIRGVKNRVRAGIKTFLQMQDSTAKSYKEKDAGKVVVYTTSMGIVRDTYQRCLQVKKILRTLLVKFEERDVFMSGEYQEEIKERMRSGDVLVPQIYVDGQHVGDADTIERLNECGELRRMLKPYKSADACTTCQVCGGYRLLPCQVCSGSKKSVHRNHFTAEFVALKCMNCDEVGLVKCEAC